MKNILLGFAALALALVGAGCGNQNKAPEMGMDTQMNDAPEMEAQEMEPIKIGFISPLTGEAATYGEPGKNVTAMAVEEINAAGGINGQMLEVIYEDGKCNGKDASNAMNKLATVDKVQAIIGGFCSGESLAAAPIANDHKILLFSPGSSSPDLTEQGGAFFFRNFPSDATQAQVLADVAYNKKEWRKIAIIQEQTDYAEALQSSFAANFTELGGEVMVEKFPTGSADFRTPLTKLKGFEPDALFLAVQTDKPAENILRQASELGWEVDLMGSDIMSGGEVAKSSPELLEGMFVAEFGVNHGEAFDAFNAAYKAKYGEDVPYAAYAQTEYDAVYQLADALKEVGNDGEALRDWFANSSGWEGVSGAVEFTENGDRTVGHVPLIIHDGAVVPFDEMAEE
ncbi:ABC transporter substrate-binding protein [Candidatus Nomurabacteria bacterium]|nr:ABC transporter substrate-binding protein [Candidatus Nomurabacteria bacterium]